MDTFGLSRFLALKVIVLLYLKEFTNWDSEKSTCYSKERSTDEQYIVNWNSTQDQLHTRMQFEFEPDKRLTQIEAACSSRCPPVVRGGNNNEFPVCEKSCLDAHLQIGVSHFHVGSYMHIIIHNMLIIAKAI